MRLRISMRGRVRPSVCPSVRLYVPCYFWMTNMAIFNGKIPSNGIIINDTMTNDEVFASDVPLWYLFLFWTIAEWNNLTFGVTTYRQGPVACKQVWQQPCLSSVQAYIGVSLKVIWQYASPNLSPLMQDKKVKVPMTILYFITLFQRYMIRI